VAAAAVLVAAAVTAGVVVTSDGQEATSAPRQSQATTAKVERGRLSAVVSLNGTLTYRARPDGSPYPIINQARGTYTRLPEAGDRVGCGDVLYRVDEHPVLLLCGTVPAYRDLHSGDEGRDVWQLNRNLRRLGYHPGTGAGFTWRTERAVRRLQHHVGLDVTGKLAAGDAVFLPRAVRIAKVTGERGGSARPGAQVAQATSDTLAVQVDLDASQQGQVKQGDRARITLPGRRSVKARVARLGRVASSAGKDGDPGTATIPASVRLDDPAKARRLDRAPVGVEITTRGVESALSVPVTALVGRSGGGFAVEVVRAAGRRELVAVELGLLDDTDGRVQVEGDLAEGDDVVVPSP
jgi:hypothetical protein